MTDELWMRHALELAARAEREDDEVPVGAVLVSSALAAGNLAGLPVAGLYSLMLPLAVFALFSSSRQMVVGPDVTMATLVATSLVPLAAGDPLRS